MKHLKVFLTHDDYLDFTETPDYVLPNVSYCVNSESLLKSVESLLKSVHPDVHYNPLLKITYHIDQSLASISTKAVAPDPVVIAVDFINPNLTLSDYIKDITYNGSTISAELFEEHPALFSPGDYTFLLTLKNVALISSDMFRNCNLITKVVIPDSVDTINTRAFYGCTELKTIDLGKVTNINNYAFCGCENLSELSRGLINNINPTALSCEK